MSIDCGNNQQENMEWSWINNPSDLKSIFTTKKPRIIGLDTEFNSWNTYYGILKLVQISFTDGDILLVDPLIKGMKEVIAEILTNSDITKVIHSAYFDLSVLRYYCGVAPVNYFDTQIAAELTGIGSTLGYVKLVKKYFGVELSKKQQKSKWGKRPLSEAQLTYAAADVKYLIPLYIILSDELALMGRQEWLRQETELLSHLTQECITCSQWPHLEVSDIVDMSKDTHKRVLRLLRWRDEFSKSENVPSSWLFSDTVAKSIAKSKNITRGSIRHATRDYDMDDDVRDLILDAVITNYDDEDDMPNLQHIASIPITKMRDTVTNIAKIMNICSGFVTNGMLRYWFACRQWPIQVSKWKRELLEPELVAALE